MSTPTPTATPLPGDCLPLLLDFDGLAHGTLLGEQYAAQGVHISGVSHTPRYYDPGVIVFDSGQSGTPDPDQDVDIGDFLTLFGGGKMLVASGPHSTPRARTLTRTETRT